MVFAGLKIKVMPESPEEDLKKIENSISEIVESLSAKMHAVEIEDVAFGLKALIITIAWPETQDLDLIEEKVAQVSGVNSVQVIDFRRAIG